MPIKGGKVGSIGKLKRDIKKRSGNFLHRVPADEPETFRFLEEPEEWFGYTEHYDESLKFFPCTGTPDCEGCQSNNNGSARWLTNAVHIEEDKVVPLVLPKSAVNDLMRHYDRHNTVLDRDYVITRTGTGKNDTEYHVDPEAPTPIRAAKYKKSMVDLEEMLEKQLPQPLEDELTDDEPEDDAAPKRAKKATAKKAAAAPAKRTRKPEPVDEDDDETDDGDEGSEEALRAELNAMKLPRLKSVARTEYEIDPDDLQGLDKGDIVDMIVEAAFGDEDADEEDAEDEDEADEEDESEEDESEEDDEADDEGDEGEDDYPRYPSADLRKMDLEELQGIADDYGIKYRSNTKAPKLISDIIAAQNEYFGEDDDNPPY